MIEPETMLTLKLTPEEAERFNRTIHRALCLLNELPILTNSVFAPASVRADLLRLAAMLDDAAPSATAEHGSDPFAPEGDGSARDVLLGRIVGTLTLLLDNAPGLNGAPRREEFFQYARERLLRDWNEYEELSRG